MNDKTSSDTILIVDDQPDNLKVLLTLLRKTGFNVLLAGDGEESLQVTKHAHPNLILLDIMMPGGISGFEVCKRLKSAETTRHIPIIFMTALTDTVNKINGFKLGAADYITKPFQHEELLARINAHLSIRKLQQELTQQNQLLKNEVKRSQKLEAAQQKTHLLLEQTLKSRGSSGSDDLEKCQTELKKCHTELDTFAHAITHDLKNPLNTIITLSQQLGKNYSQNRPQLDAQSTKALQLLSEAGQLAANLVDNLHVLVSRQEPVELELLEMSDIVTFVIEKRLAPMIKQHQAKIKLAEIWPSVPGYGPWLKEIWVNYISNGLKYGGKHPHLELGATPHHHEMVRFWIRDNGQGLTPEEQAKLFTPQSPLHQVHVKEHGLGLPMVQQLVEKMGGQVGVESTKGQGCLFYFTLPAYK